MEKYKEQIRKLIKERKIIEKRRKRKSIEQRKKDKELQKLSMPLIRACVTNDIKLAKEVLENKNININLLSGNSVSRDEELFEQDEHSIIHNKYCLFNTCFGFSTNSKIIIVR